MGCDKLLICLDGFSSSDYWTSSKNCKWLERALGKGSLLSLTGSLFQSPQAAWAELLTGCSWLENGIYGYSYLENSIDDVQICSENNLLRKTPFSNQETDKNLIANIPLLLPKQNRIWLSDGSMPLTQQYYPADLKGLDDYKARALLSPALTGAQLQNATELVLANELKRLSLCLELLEQHHCKLAVIRLTAFDTMFHMFGANFLQSDSFRYKDTWLDFLSKLDQLLNKLESFCGLENCALFSCYSHTPCLKLLDLNQILCRAGFLQAAKKSLSTSASAGRRALAISAIRPEISENELLELGGTSYLPKSSLAFSAVESTISINASQRFFDGIVQNSEQSKIALELESLISLTLQATNLEQYQVINSQEYSQEKDSKYRGPDLVISAPGAAFRSAAFDSGVGDWSPRTVHARTGFLLAPKEWLPGQTSANTPIADLSALHKILFA